MSRRPASLLAAGLSCAALATGCGGALAPDLFEVLRSGPPGAQLDLVVSDDGMVRCDRGAKVMIAGADLLTARGLVAKLDNDALEHTALAPGRTSVLSYRVRLMNGTVSFSDTSRGVSAAMLQLAALTHELARSACHDRFDERS